MSVLAGVYGAVVGVRNHLYQSGRLRAERLRGAVVSVGNISVGGAGKTPFTIMLGELLKQRHIPFDVISRGYGRATRGVFEVDPNGSARDYGDEPLLIARSLAVPVIVGEKRIDAGRYAEEKYGPRIHLLDDGFQHRQLARDFDIVMVSSADLGGRLLPVGKLREPVSSLQRADVLVVPPGTDDSSLLAIGKPVWYLRRSLALPADTPSRVIAFCGIARPERFISELKECGILPMAQISFGDHHSYRNSDVRRLLREHQRTGAIGFITTAKDEINLGTLAAQLHNLKVARVQMELQDSGEALDFMLRTIESRRGATHKSDSATERRS